MADFLSTGVSGLQAFQRALDTTSHNIANVGTDGYSRQRADFMTRPPQAFGSNWIGSGVAVSSVQRIYDDLLAQQVRTSSSGFESADAFAAQTGRINNLFGNTTTGLTASLQKFVNGLQEVANAPASIASRQVMLGEARGLAERLKSYDSQLGQFDRDVESRITSEASTVTSLAKNIAQLNGQIADGFARTGQPPNDLLDQRDRALDQLSAHINISTVKQDDGQLNVFVGSGQPLVIAGQSNKLVSVADPYDSARHGVALQVANGNPLDITSSLTGGTLGGLVDFRTQVLDPTRNSLGRLSVGLADVINQQQHAGIDLTGALGTDLFAVGGVQTLSHEDNLSAASVTATRVNTGALTEGDYVLQLTAGGWALKRSDTGAAVTMTGAGTGASPFVADGFQAVVSGTAQVGDRYLIRPTRGAVGGLNVLTADPARFAAAAPIRAAAASTNDGTGEISPGEVLNSANPQLRSTVTLQFLTASTYSINGAGSFAYTSGGNIDVNGWRVTLSGAPAVGDQFTISDNAGGSGDNRNALAMVDALSRPVLDGGTVSLDAQASRMVGNVGVATSQAQATRDAQSIVHDDSVQARDGVSGVNLDEEAANLLRYQQAYQAAAQVIRIASTLFDTLLAAAR
jgi:flagellar hook-associated protein 1 FlgK